MLVSLLDALLLFAILVVIASCLTDELVYRSENINDALFYLQKAKTLFKPHDLVAYFQDTVTNCAQACLSTQGCSAFSFSGMLISTTINCILVNRESMMSAQAISNESWNHYQVMPNTMCKESLVCDHLQSYPGGKFGYGGCNCLTFTVVSRGKAASQSSTYFGCPASRAVDGNKDSNLWNGSCTHTTKDAYPWWRVDLGEKHYIASIAITNRGDCCPERLDNAKLHVGMSLENNGSTNPLCTTTPVKIAAGKTKEYLCEEGFTFGRYVIISLPPRQPFSLCEVEVFGIKVYRDS